MRTTPDLGRLISASRHSLKEAVTILEYEHFKTGKKSWIPFADCRGGGEDGNDLTEAVY